MNGEIIQRPLCLKTNNEFFKSCFPSEFSSAQIKKRLNLKIFRFKSDISEVCILKFLLITKEISNTSKQR